MKYYKDMKEHQRSLKLILLMFIVPNKKFYI